MSATEPYSVVTCRVISVEAFRVRLRLARAAHDNGRRTSHVEHVLLRVRDGGGTVGWGEAIPEHGTAREVQAMWRALRDHLVPDLLSHEWTRPEEISDQARTTIRGLPAPTIRRATAGLDMACWDLWTRLRRTPLSHALGGSRTAVAAGVRLSTAVPLDALLRHVNQNVNAGYRRVTLDIVPGRDIEPVRAVVRAFPNLMVQVDAAGAYRPTRDDLAILAALDDYGLALIEQPFPPDDLLAHASLRNRLATPICLGQSITDLATLDRAIEFGAAQILNLGVARLGGISAAARAHNRCLVAGWRAWCGGAREFGIGRAANIAVASLPGCTLPADVPASGTQFVRDVVEPPVTAHDGLVAVPLSRPGLGHDVDEDFVRAATTDTFTVEPVT